MKSLLENKILLCEGGDPLDPGSAQGQVGLGAWSSLRW